ncbi:TonB-dependent siderophore receptor [Gluconacetobacter sp.]|uniref:TonB-dependent siderophore receptor n=1 Tax=Gluconacetobacter sp. TaxID=1935994 RepID=UPI0039EBDE0B
MHPKIATAGADLLSVNARERTIRAPLVTLSLMRMLGLTTALASVVIVPIKAASADTPASTTSVERKFTLNIPAQKLSSALVALSNATGTQLAYGTELSDGLRSSAISGTMPVSAALTQILNGTGLTYRLSGNVVTLVKASANITLGPIRVGGQVARQDPTGPGSGYFAENTMSATKTDTPITEIPSSIYVVTKQQMLDQGAQTVMDALKYTAGLYAGASGTFNNGNAAADSISFYQRGFSTNQFVDGLLSNSQSAGETAFLERIEAINGPASVMYGQTTPGGMLAMSLKKPTDTPLHQVSVGFGNWGRYQSTVDFSDKLTKSGNLRYRVAGLCPMAWCRNWIGC